MSQFPETPLQIDNPAPDGITFEGPQANFADDEEVANHVVGAIVPMMREARDARRLLNAEWLEVQKMAFMQHGSSQAYNGRSNMYIPAYAKNLDARVSHISKALFPTDDFLSAVAYEDEFKQYELPAKAWMQYQLGRCAKLRSRMKPWVRQLHDFGASVGKIWYQKCETHAFKGRRKARAGKNNPLEALMATFDNQADSYGEGIRFRTVSMFAWHAWPLTVNNLDECSLIFEDIQVSKFYADAMFESGEWINENSLQPGSYSESDTDRQEQLQTITGLSSTALDQMHGDAGDWREVSEVYTLMPIPNRYYHKGEVPGSVVPVQIIVGGGQPLCVRRCPFFFGKSPFVFKTLNERSDSLYAAGMGRAAMDLQALLNDFANQTNDNGIYALSPIAKVNPNIVSRMGKIAPGSVWYMSDRSGLEFDRPPHEQLQYGMMLSGQAFNWMNDLLGAPPIMQGTGGKGAAKTATGAQILQNNVGVDIQDTVEAIEEEVLEPLMEMAFALGAQYEGAYKMAVVAGKRIEIPQNMWGGQYMFNWMASSQTANNVMRNQQAMQLLQTFMNPIFMQLAQQHGRMLNPLPLARRLYEGGLGYRDFDDVMHDISEMGMAPMMGGQAPGLAESGQPGAPPSPVEQAIYGQEQAPGEAEAFGEVRQGADQMAGAYGSMNGTGEG